MLNCSDFKKKIQLPRRFSHPNQRPRAAQGLIPEDRRCVSGWVDVFGSDLEGWCVILFWRDVVRSADTQVFLRAVSAMKKRLEREAAEQDDDD